MDWSDSGSLMWCPTCILLAYALKPALSARFLLSRDWIYVLGFLGATTAIPSYVELFTSFLLLLRRNLIVELLLLIWVAPAFCIDVVGFCYVLSTFFLKNIFFNFFLTHIT